jgi:hypothetical protein
MLRWYGGAEKCSEKALSIAADDVSGNYWRYAFNTNVCFRGYVSFATLTIKHAARRQAAKRLLGNVPNFGHSEVLIKITDEMPLLLAPRDKFVTLNIFGRKFSVDFPARENRSTKCVDLVFFTGGSFCEGRAGAGVFSDILNVQGIICLRLSCYSLSIRSICYLACSECCILEGIVNGAVSICSLVLQCRDSLQKLALYNRVRLVWVPGHCGIYGNEEANASLARAGSSSAFVGPELCFSVGTFECQAEGVVT